MSRHDGSESQCVIACVCLLAAACFLCVSQEWWNAATLADYWKLWNIPVHKWMLRTIFFPLVRRGAPRLASLLFVFFVSAVMHELAVGVPLRMLRGWAFWGMMLQVSWGRSGGARLLVPHLAASTSLWAVSW